MKKKLFYVIEKLLYPDDESLNGNKSITVYEIIDNYPKVFFSLDLELSQNTEEEIQEYLDCNGYGDDEFELVQL